MIRENGDFTPEILSSYITDEVFKQAQRVEDSLSKVRQAMAAQVSVGSQDPPRCCSILHPKPELETVEEEVDGKDMALYVSSARFLLPASALTPASQRYPWNGRHWRLFGNTWYTRHSAQTASCTCSCSGKRQSQVGLCSFGAFAARLILDIQKRRTCS